MEQILDNEHLDDKFLVFITRISFKEFKSIFEYEDEKKIRNDYDNRLKGKNLFFYFYFFKNEDKDIEIRKLRRMNKVLSKNLSKTVKQKDNTSDKVKDILNQPKK